VKLPNAFIRIFILLGVGMMSGTVAIAEAGNPLIRVIHQQGLEVRLDLSTQVLGLEVLEDRDWGRSVGKVEAELYPTLQSLPRGADFVSASIMVAKAKQFDDGLYAAVEYLCQDGTEKFMGKRELLQQVAQALQELKKVKGTEGKPLSDCQSIIHAAAYLGGHKIANSQDIQSRAKEIISKFLSSPLNSKPIGFYTWTEELAKIFQQDRLLQEKLDPEKIGPLAQALSYDENVKKAYQVYLSLVKKLTNPYPPEYGDLTQALDMPKEKQYNFFPPSRSVETELVKKLYGGSPIPEGFNLLDTLVRKIQRREIDLTPKEESGWYDYQIYGLEPFVNPELMVEAKRLYLGEGYKKELIDLFKASIAFTRESHVKQLEIPKAGAAPADSIPTIEIYPELSLEPVATYYLRRAKSYRFLQELLDATFERGALKNIRRLTPSGRGKKPLAEELLEIESLFYGVYQIAAEEIGLDISAQPPERSKQAIEADKKLIREWIRTFQEDPDVGRDNRMMVPVFHDIGRGKIKVWVVLGYSAKPLSIWFKQEPTATIVDATGKKGRAKINFQGIQKKLIYPVSSEMYVKRLLNRDEFRALCDKYKTPSAIIKALQNL
jgi:hypothetical protein